MGYIHERHLRFTKNQLLKSVKQFFQVTEKLIELIEDQKEINNLTTIDYKELTWRSTSLLCDKAFEITDAKTYVFAHSVLSEPAVDAVCIAVVGSARSGHVFDAGPDREDRSSDVCCVCDT